MSAILGIDVAQNTLAVALWREGQALEQAEFANTRTGFKTLQRWLKRRQAAVVHACLEATGRYWENLAYFLVETGHTVSVVNPARIKAYAQSQLTRNKTDKLDAATIADFCRTQQPAPWTPLPPAYQELQLLVRHLDDLETDRQRETNRLHALRQAAYPSSVVCANVQHLIDFLDAQITQVKQQIQDYIDHDPDLKQQRHLLDSIVGIAPLTAAKLMAEYGDMSQFSDVRQVVAFAGLNPRHHQSGSSIRGKTIISKVGRASIRAALYMPAMAAMRHDATMAAFAARLAARGLKPLQVIAAVMRKLLHLAFGILKSRQPYQRHYPPLEASNS
jgi:transposase